MASYSFNDMGRIEIDFDGVKPSVDIRNKMKAVKYRWNPNKMIWWAYKNDDTVAVAEEICGKTSATAPAETPLREKLKDVLAMEMEQVVLDISIDTS